MYKAENQKRLRKILYIFLLGFFGFVMYFFFRLTFSQILPYYIVSNVSK